MLHQALISILIGTGISLVAFVPILIHQFRRYGKPSPGRMTLIFTNFVYITAVIAYTIFPVPSLSREDCAGNSHMLVLDPTEYFRDMAHQFAGQSVTTVLTSWAMLQMLLNVALFVPLGFYARRLLRLRPWPSILLGFGTSLLIETTQYTGNWFLARCQYRVADVNDLLTNTLGAALGVLATNVIPRLSDSPEKLETQAGKPREVTRGRRMLALLIDVWWVILINLIGLGLITAVALVIMAGDPSLKPRVEQAFNSYGSITLAALNVCYVIVAMSGRLGVSPGSGTAHLAWVDASGNLAGRRHSFVMGACLIIAQLWGSRVGSWSSIGDAMLVLEALSVLFTPRGLIGKLMGLQLVDSRTLEPAPRRA
ncbi:VanZ family protein [Cutibacterium granulosum]|uniref:VanZ family protein n=1 Tax=Cutibacterium granulosum TaxID=33011 RepID=UPI0023F9F078|nr:VanZ family protein [Cutibacterium granulosum]